MDDPAPCQLLEPDGQPLSAGRCDRTQLRTTGVTPVLSLDQPGRVVKRCLLDGLRHVVLAVGSERLPAVVEQVTFDGAAGHSCRLRLEGVPSATPGSASPGNDVGGFRAPSAPPAAGPRRRPARRPGSGAARDWWAAASLTATSRSALIDRVSVAAGSLALAERFSQRHTAATAVLGRLAAAYDALRRAQQLLTTGPRRASIEPPVRPWEPLPPALGSWAAVLATLAPAKRAQVRAAIATARQATQAAGAVVRTDGDRRTLQTHLATATEALRDLSVLRRLPPAGADTAGAGGSRASSTATAP